MTENLELTPFRHLIDRVPHAVRPHFRRLFLPIAVPLMAIGVVTAIFQANLMGDIFADPESFGEAGLALGSFFLMILALIAVYMLAFSALMVGSADALRGQPIEMGRAWLFPLRPSVLATLIVVGAANVLAVIMCLLPALYVAPITAFVMPVMIIEGKVGFAAVRRSLELAHFNPTGRWFDSVFLKILAFLTVAMIINYGLNMTVQLPFAVVQQIIIFRDAAAGAAMDPAQMMTEMTWLQVPAQLLTALATAAVWLYWTFGTVMLYNEVRRGKEAEDLRQAVEQLTGDSAPAHGAP